MKYFSSFAKAAVALPLFGALALLPAHAEKAVTIAPPAQDITAQNTANGDGLQTAVLAGGCFWGMQAVYQHVKGVTKAVSGYAGGNAQSADYSSVSSGNTGHAESVQVTFDPRVVSYGKILQIYFSVAHNPTELNRQGPDSGTQYRSEIFPRDDAQRAVAAAYVKQLGAAHAYSSPVVTKIDSSKSAFYPAEGYHQDYLVNHPGSMYIVINDAPKVANLKKMFPELYREAPVTVASSGS